MKERIIGIIIELVVIILIVVLAGKSAYNNGYYDGVQETLCPEGNLVFDQDNLLKCSNDIVTFKSNMDIGGFNLDDLQT